jgi:hypothetical protein
VAEGGALSLFLQYVIERHIHVAFATSRAMISAAVEMDGSKAGDVIAAE